MGLTLAMLALLLTPPALALGVGVLVADMLADRPRRPQVPVFTPPAPALDARIIPAVTLTEKHRPFWPLESDSGGWFRG